MATNGQALSVDDILQALAPLDPGAKRYVFSEALKPNSTEEVLDITRTVTLDALRTVDWTALDYPEKSRLWERTGVFLSDVAQNMSQEGLLNVSDRLRRNAGISDYPEPGPYDPAAEAQAMAFRLQQMAEQRVNTVVIALIAVFILIAIGLLGAIVWKPESAQYVATVFTSLLGALAGFISGRSTGSGGSPAGTIPSVSSQQAGSPIREEPHP